MAVSLYHQGDNLDRERILRELTGQPRQAETTHATASELHDWLSAWIDHDADPRDEMDSLAGVMQHLSDAWARRDRVQRRARRITTTCRPTWKGRCDAWRPGSAYRCRPPTWPRIVEAATFNSHEEPVPTSAHSDTDGVIKDANRLLPRMDDPGRRRHLLSEPRIWPHYHARTAALAPPDLLAWLHR